MKANLLILSLLTLSSTALFAAEALYVVDGNNGSNATSYSAYPASDYATPAQVAAGNVGAGAGANPVALSENEKDVKITTLNKLIDQQQRLYEEKVIYLEDELKKSKDRLVEKSINHDKMQAVSEKRFNEELTFLKRELVAKTKTLMEYQRQLEKIKPSEDMKNLIKVNTDLAIELRRSADQLALVGVKGPGVMANKPEATDKATRMPASVVPAK